MKNKILNLKLQFQTLSGQVVIKGILEQNPEEQQKPILLQDILVYMLGQKQASGKEAVILWSLGRRIYETKEDEIEVSDEELAFLRQIVEENPGGIFRGFLIGQIIEYFESLKR